MGFSIITKIGNLERRMAIISRYFAAYSVAFGVQ